MSKAPTILIPENMPQITESPVDVREFSTGTRTEYRLDIPNGHPYQILHYQSSDKTADTLVGTGTPLGTSVDGIVADASVELMGIGFDSVTFGPQGRLPFESQISFFRRVQLFFDQSQETSARDVHLGLDAIGEAGIAETEQVHWAGYSRPAMFGLGVLAMQNQFDRNVVYAYLEDACSPDRPKAKNVFRLPVNIVQNVVGFGLGLKEIQQRQEESEVDLLGTLDPNLRAWLFHLAKIPHLMSGQAGDFAKEVPFEQYGTLLSNLLGGANHNQRFEEIFKDHPFFETKRRPLSHTGPAGADPAREMIRRFEEVAKAELGNGEFDEAQLEHAAKAGRLELGLQVPKPLIPDKVVELRAAS